MAEQFKCELKSLMARYEELYKDLVKPGSQHVIFVVKSQPFDHDGICENDSNIDLSTDSERFNSSTTEKKPTIVKVTMNNNYYLNVLKFIILLIFNC